MYNEAVKTKFIEETSKTEVLKQYATCVFSTTEKYENLYGKDVCLFSQAEMKSMFDEAFGTRASSVKRAIVKIKTYTRWCEKNKLQTGDGIYSIKIDLSSKMKKTTVASPFHLQTILDQVFDPVSVGNVHILYRVYYWLAFSGLTEEEALYLTVDEVDFDGMIITHGGNEYEIYREAIPALRAACFAETFRYDNPCYQESIDRQRKQSPYVFRSVRTERVTVDAIHSSIRKSKKDSVPSPTFSKIFLSGVFYRAFEMERAGAPVNFDSIAEHVLGRNVGYENLKGVRKKYPEELYNLKKEYGQWKEAFNAQ